MPTSHRLQPRRDQFLEHGGGELQVGIAGRDERHQRLAALAFAIVQKVRRSQTSSMQSVAVNYPNDSPRSRAISAASLSPRPERQTTTTSSFGRCAGKLHRFGHGVRAFQRRQDAFGAGQGVEGGQRVVVAAAGVLHAAGVFPIAVLGADAGIIEAGRDASARRRSGRRRPASRSCSCRAARRAGRSESGAAWSPGLADRPPASTPTQLDLRRVRRTDRTCRPRCCRRRRRRRPGSGKRPSCSRHCSIGFAADDRLKIADDPRKRMRADDRAEDVVRGFDRATSSRAWLR